MDWYYAADGQQRGPVSEAELARLLSEGFLTGDTLVWRPGMTDWQPYRIVAAEPPAAAAPMPGVRYGGFGARAIALIIDGMLTAAIRNVVLAPMGFHLMDNWGSPWGWSRFFWPIVGEIQIISIALNFCYYVLFWTYYGATPGKMLFKLKVVTPEGNLVSIGQAAGRYFAMWLSGIILGIGYLMAAFDDQRRTLHDRLANTRVIRLS